MRIYPNQLAENLEKLWYERGLKSEYLPIPDLPEKKHLVELLEVAYHSSFMTEESRKVKFRIVFIDRNGDIKDESLRRVKHNVIPFINPRAYNSSELLRLAPATDPTKVLICVDLNADNELEIWGLVDSGLSWYGFTNGESSKGTPPPNEFTISSQEPGNLTITRGGWIIADLRGGRLSEPLGNVLYNGPINDFINNAYSQLKSEVCESLQIDKYDSNDDNTILKRYIKYIERLLYNIKQKNHGGTLIIVPHELQLGDSRLEDRINIKYSCTYRSAWDLVKDELFIRRKHYDLSFSFPNSTENQETISIEDFWSYRRNKTNLEEAENSLLESIKFVSALSGVDGALVMDDKLNIVGFGAEVIVPSPSLKKVKVAEDTYGNGEKYISIESFGTRHRSAFRFCSSYENSVAFVVSQDGGIKAVKRVGPDLVMWPDISIGYLGI